MASEELRAVFTAVETISQTLQSVEQSISSLQNKFSGLDASMAGNTATSQATETQLERLGSTVDDVEDEISAATRSLEVFTGVQNINIATAATQAGAMELAREKIEDMGNEAIKTSGKLGVLDTVMKELSLSGSALSVNIGAFNVSLRNLAPLVPIAATMGTVVSIIGAFVVALGNATVALGAFTGAGAIAFAEDMQEQFDGLTDNAETLEAIMGGIGDLFIEAFRPLTEAEGSAQFFVNMIEGLADLANRFAQAVNQMRGIFLPFFGQIADLVNEQFDAINTAFANTFADMAPIILTLIDWFLTKLPDALRFMTAVTTNLAGPIGDLGNSLLGLLRSIIEVAVSIGQGLLPAFSVALDLATEIIDVFSVLGNGFLQATLFLGGLILTASKFVGIANTMANVGITAANQINQFARSAGSARGAMAQLNSTFAGSFKNLQRLGKLLTGQATLAEVSGQAFNNLTQDIQNQAEAIDDAENELTAIRNAWLELNTAVQGTDVAGEATEQMNEIENKADNVANSIGNDMERLSGSVEGVEFDPKMGQAFGDDGTPIDKETLGRHAQLSNVNEDLGKSFDQIGESVKDMPRSLRFEPDEVIGGLDPDNIPEIGTDDVTRGMAIDDLSGASLGATFRESMFDASFESALSDDIPTGDFRDKFVADVSDVDTTNIDRIRDKFSGLSDGIGGATGTITDKLRGAGRRFARFSNSVAARMNSFGRSVKEGMMVAGGAISEGAQLAVAKFRQMGGISGMASSAFDRIRGSAGNAAGGLRTMASNAVTAGLSILASGAQSVAASAGFIAAKFSSEGAAAGLKAMATSAWGAVTALASSAATAAMAAVTFVAGLIPATISAGTALNVAFAGIPAILGAIAVVAGIAVGVLSNMDSVTTGAKSAFEGLKNVISAIGMSLLKIGVPAWNLFIDVLEMFLAPVFGIIDGFRAIGEELGIVSDEGDGLGSILGVLLDGFDAIMAASGAFLDFLAPAVTVVGDVLFTALVVPLKAIAAAIHLVKAIFTTLFDFMMDNIPFMEEFTSILVDGFKIVIDTIASLPSILAQAISIASSLIDDFMTDIKEGLQPVVDALNDIIQSSNAVLGTDFDELTVDRGGRDVSESLAGARGSSEEVLASIRSDAEEGEQDVATEPNVDLTLEDSVENNVEVEADPEDRAGLKRITKDALEEANSFARRQQGGQ